MAQDHPVERGDTSFPARTRRYREAGNGSVVTFGLISIALLLAIAFFYVTKMQADDKRADALARAAEGVDETATVVGEAARNAADALRRNR